MKYCPWFCEENVWHLCRDPDVVTAPGGPPVPPAERRVVFISNEDKAVAMRHQRAGRGGLVFWDYHVVLFARGAAGWQVWDPDCELGMPLSVERWLDESFPVSPHPARLRVVDAGRFVEVFGTDRHHMLNAQGVPIQSFPAWPPPQPPRTAGGQLVMNLMRFVDVTTAFEGEVLTLEEARQRYR